MSILSLKGINNLEAWKNGKYIGNMITMGDDILNEHNKFNKD